MEKWEESNDQGIGRVYCIRNGEWEENNDQVIGENVLNLKWMGGFIEFEIQGNWRECREAT